MINNKKMSKGITLIALVVTIIVLLLLAGISVQILTGNNGILNRVGQAKKMTDEAQTVENIQLVYSNAQIGKYTRTGEEFATTMQTELEKIYGTGKASVTDNGNGTFTVKVDGKNYDIDADGNITKQGASIVVGEATIKDASGNEVTTKIQQGSGTVYIHFTASIAGGTITSVSSTGLSPTLTNGEWVTEVNANGTYEFTINGTTEDENISKTKSVIVNKFSNGLKVGDTVIYTPSGSYSWKAKYASSDLAVTKQENGETVEDSLNDILLSSENGGEFRITTWKVLSINETSDEVQLVPSAPTTGTVRLQGAQGYNNAVKLLNDACDELYSTKKNETKIISARSINMEDFEGKVVNNERVDGVLTTAAITARDAYENNSTDKIKYNNRYSSPNSGYRDASGNYKINKNYPVMYGLEADSIVNGATTSGTLGMSSQTSFIERLDENLAAVAEKVTNATSIKPKQTYYNLGTSYNTIYKRYFKKYENNGTKYFADLLSPSGSSTNYWVASRCINLGDLGCSFHVSRVYSGCLFYCHMCGSNASLGNGSLGLFPVVSLSSELITKNGSNFQVESQN